MACLASHSMVSIEYCTKKRKKFSYIAKNENLIFSTLSDDPVLEVSTIGNRTPTVFSLSYETGCSAEAERLSPFMKRAKTKMAFRASL